MLGSILVQILAIDTAWGLEQVPVQVRAVQNEQIQNQTLFWGTYRPNLFFGTRTRSKDTLVSGLMWQSLNSLELSDNMRHNCEEWESFKKNGYLIHDSRNFGEQIIEDIETNFRIKTQFVKSGFGKHGGDWGVKISGEVIDPEQDAQLSLYYYFGMHGDGHIYHVPADSGQEAQEETDEDEEDDSEQVNTTNDDDDNSLKFEGESPELGKFKISVHGGHSSDQLKGINLPPQMTTNDISTTNLLGIKVPDNYIWRVRDFVLNHIVEMAEPRFKPLVPLIKKGDMDFPSMSYLFQMDNIKMPDSNLFVVQKILKGDFEIEIIFNEETNQQKSLDKPELNKLIPILKKKFQQKFETKFDLKSKKLSKKEIQLGQFALSNLLGGIGYFNGDSMVIKGSKLESNDSDDDDWDEDEDNETTQSKENSGDDFDLTKDYSLFTAVPSRTFFPRGFLWDEGFHQLLISEWDLELSISIVNSWFDTMTDNGWIPREQILGDEARSRVPKEFQVQNPEFANPPTLYLFIEKLAQKLKTLKHKPIDRVHVEDFDHDLESHKSRKNHNRHAGNHHDSMDDSVLTESHLEDYEMGLHWLKQLYERKLKKNYNWYRTTQRGVVPPNASKVNQEVYRWRGRQENHTLPSGFDDFPRPEVSDGELHVDLTSWIGFMAGVMEKIADVVEDTEGRELYQRHQRDIQNNLKNLFWDQGSGIHCDIGVNSNDDNDDEEEEEEEEFDNTQFQTERVCHVGYPTLLPFALQLIDVTSPEFPKILAHISNPDHLWSPYGIRSLSKSDVHYRTGEDYWRGNIWLNVNYLVLRSLHHYKTQPSDHQDEITRVYDDLRSNLIKTLGDSFDKTNLVWEQYSDETGDGMRSKPFTGWSSLILLIMSEKFD